MNAVDLSFRRPDDCRVLMFPDASDLFWGRCLTQVPKEELVAGLSFMDMSHEPLAFLSDMFRGSQLCWPTVDKESFTILSACRTCCGMARTSFAIIATWRTFSARNRVA